MIPELFPELFFLPPAAVALDSPELPPLPHFPHWLELGLAGAVSLVTALALTLGG
jgi:hypothetical protein